MEVDHFGVFVNLIWGYVELGFAAPDWDPKVFGGATAEVRKPAGEDPHTAFEWTNTKLGGGTGLSERDQVWDSGQWRWLLWISEQHPIFKIFGNFFPFRFCTRVQDGFHMMEKLYIEDGEFCWSHFVSTSPLHVNNCSTTLGTLPKSGPLHCFFFSFFSFWFQKSWPSSCWRVWLPPTRRAGCMLYEYHGRRWLTSSTF